MREDGKRLKSSSSNRRSSNLERATSPDQVPIIKVIAEVGTRYRLMGLRSTVGIERKDGRQRKKRRERVAGGSEEGHKSTSTLVWLYRS